MDLSALDELPVNSKRDKWAMIVAAVGAEDAAEMMARVAQRWSEGVSLEDLAKFVDSATGVGMGISTLSRILKTRPWA